MALGRAASDAAIMALAILFFCAGAPGIAVRRETATDLASPSFVSLATLLHNHFGHQAVPPPYGAVTSAPVSGEVSCGREL
ncbi:MAG: hypothetical protein ACO3JL_13790 [Myxococcota bacterium]